MDAAEMQTHHDLSEMQRDNISRMLHGTDAERDEVAAALSGLISEACTPEQFADRGAINRLFNHVTMARGLMAASEKAYRLGEVPRAKFWASTAELFLCYAVADIADIEAIATRYEMGEPQ